MGGLKGVQNTVDLLCEWGPPKPAWLTRRRRWGKSH